MCGRYNITKKALTLEQELEIKILEKELFEAMVNIAPGDLAPILLNDYNDPQFYQFGLTPFWAKKKMYLFNARAEGDFNKENDSNYTGEKGIFEKPSFRKSIKTQRCLVIANSFIEGPEEAKLNQPYLICRKDLKSFTFGGIWDEWINEETGEIINSFAIITTAASSITKEIGHHRAPLIINADNREEWTNPNTSSNRIADLMIPFDGEYYKAYRISKKIKNARNKDLELLKPVEDDSPPPTLFSVNNSDLST